METTHTGSNIMKILLKDLTVEHTISSLAREAGISRVGMWKILKKMEKDRFILLSPVGIGRTSTCIISLNWDNNLVEKMLALALAEDAEKNRRWLNTFAELEGKADFAVIYGSIIHSPRQARDIDLLAVTSNKKTFMEIESTIIKIQKTEAKRIHLLSLLEEELREELKKPNKAFIDALKKGIVLFGHEGFISFMREIRR